MLLEKLWKVLDNNMPIWINYEDDCHLVEPHNTVPYFYMNKRVTYMTLDGEGVMTIEVE